MDFSDAATSGVLYLSIGESYGRLTSRSIGFLRQTGYRGAIRVVSDDSCCLASVDCEVILVPTTDLGFATRHHKTQLNQYGFENTLYLDADTLPVGSIAEIWSHLDSSDICLATDLEATVAEFVDVSWAKPEAQLTELSFMNQLNLRNNPYFNSGVMLWHRCKGVDDLFASWHREWGRFGSLDQMALVRALVETDMQVRVLDRMWNCPANHYDSIGAAQTAGARILHFLSKQRYLIDEFIAAHCCNQCDNKPAHMTSG